MRTKSKPKIKKNKIPFCPKKIKPINKIIKINPEIPLIKHYKHPSTPMTLFTKKFETKINNKKEIKNENNKKNPFHAIIPKRNSNSEKKIRKQRVILIKKYNSQKIDITSNNIKNNYHKNKNLNNSKSETKCDTNSRISSVFSDRNTNQKNTINNMFEFTFSNSNFVKNKIKKDKDDINLNLNARNPRINKTNTNYSYHKKNNNRIINIKKNIGIKNIKLINNKINLNNKNLKNNKRTLSKGEKDKKKNESKDKENKKIKKNNSRKNINNTSKIPKKFISLIPHEKQRIKKKFSINTNNEMSNKNSNDISNTPKDKDNQNQIHKLLLNISQKTFIRMNKSNPKLFIKHPSLKKFFDS